MKSMTPCPEISCQVGPGKADPSDRETFREKKKESIYTVLLFYFIGTSTSGVFSDEWVLLTVIGPVPANISRSLSSMRRGPLSYNEQPHDWYCIEKAVIGVIFGRAS
jgi:hypothetical protein